MVVGDVIYGYYGRVGNEKKSTSSVQLVIWGVKSVDGVVLNHGFSSGR